MNKSIDYKKIGIYYLIANVFNKGIAFLTIPIFTRILSTNDYGIVNTYNSMVGILSMLLGFALHMGIRASFVDKKEETEDVLVSNVFFTLCIGLLILIFFKVICFFINLNFRLIYIALINALSIAIIDDYIMYLMMKYKFKNRIIFMIFPNLLSVFFSIIIIVFFLEENLYLGRIVVNAIIITIFAFVAIINSLKQSNNIKKEHIVYSLKISIPLIMHGIALNVLSQSDRIMITALADPTQTAIYSLIYNFGMIATVITTSLEGVWIPWQTEKLNEKSNDEINNFGRYYIFMMTYLLFCVIMIAPEIVKIMAPKEYWEGIIIVPLIVSSNYIVFLYSLYVNIEHYYKKTLEITVSTIVAALSNIVLNYLLIPKYGYIAAAFTTLLSYSISLYIHYKNARNLSKVLFPFKMIVIPLFCLSFSIVFFYFTIDKVFLRFFIVVLVSLSILYTIKKKNILQLLNQGGKNNE